jgi:hypothetical protein
VSKLRIAMGFAGVILMAASASAQTKISGTIHCAKPDQQNAIAVGDRPTHAFVLMKNQCIWTAPMKIDGVRAMAGEDTGFVETYGGTSRDSGYNITTMENGDQFVVSYLGTSTVDRNGALQLQTGMWSFVSGTGKLKGITGKGIYKGTGASDGGITTEIEGEYQIAGK